MIGYGSGPRAVRPWAHRLLIFLGLFAAMLVLQPILCAPPVAAQQSHLVIVAGLGGEARFSESFAEWGRRMHDAALASGVEPEHVWFLAEDPSVDPERIRARSDREGVEAAFARTAEQAAAEDRFLLLLIGHGSGTGADSRVSLPGPSLRAGDYAALLDGLPMRSVAVVNAASASGDFIQALAGEDRVVVTATRSASQRNATIFGEHFVAAFEDAAADLDRDGRVSLLEAFEYARQETERYYADRGLLPSEQALIAEGAGGRGVRLPLEEEGVGALAAAFVLQPRAVPVAVEDPEDARRLQELYDRRDALEARVAELGARRTTMDPEAYQAALQPLLVELAQVGQAIRALEGGGA